MDELFVIVNGILKTLKKECESVTIPANVIKLGKGVFQGSKIVSVTFEGNNLKSIEDNAFKNCTCLKNIMIPDGVVQIGDNAFYGCTCLDYVGIPNSVILVGEDILGDCNQDLFIIGDKGTEAENIANQYKFVLKTNGKQAVDAFNQASVTKNNKETKSFDIFGETVICSNTLSLYYASVIYYTIRKKEVYQEFCQNIPKTISEKFGDLVGVLKKEEDILSSRLSSHGVFTNNDTLSFYILEPYQAIAEVVKSIREVYDDVNKNVNEVKQSLLDDARSKVTGLSYGIVGNSLDMLLYTIDDTKARKAQFDAAMNDAKKEETKFTNKGNEIYSKFITEILPQLRPGIDRFVDGLCKSETDSLIKAGLIDETVEQSIDVQKSFELLNSIVNKDGDNSFTLALALKKYPCNITALIYAQEHGYMCQEMTDMVRFLGLERNFNDALYVNKQIRCLKIKEELKPVLSYNEGIAIIRKSADCLDDCHIKDLLTTLATSLTSFIEKLLDIRHDNPENYWSQGFPTLIQEDAWKYYQDHDVVPFQSSKIPVISDYDELKQWVINFSKAKNNEAEEIYLKASETLSKAKKASDFDEAAKLFKKLGNYKDSDTKSKNAKSKAKKKRIKQVISAFIAIILISSAIYAGPRVYDGLIIPSQQYSAAMQLYNNGEYEAACKAFEALDGFKDSEEQITNCYRCIYNEKYNAALTLFNDGKYEEAKSAFSALIATKASNYSDLCDQIEKCVTIISDEQYDAALALYNAGQYKESIAAFIALNGYKDSAAQIEKNYIEIYGEEKWNKIKNINVGDIYKFGAYEQDNKTSNGKETIKWIVLAKEYDKILVISEKGLDCQKYNTKQSAATTWETCSLRQWLNNTFINTAFSAEEQSQILSTIVTADKNPECNSNQGNDTTDKVFLLSVTEAKKYFSSIEDRLCFPTAYAIAQGAYTNKSSTEANCHWALRTIGKNGYYFTYAHENNISVYGDSTTSNDICVRPALWINLGS